MYQDVRLLKMQAEAYSKGPTEASGYFQVVEQWNHLQWREYSVFSRIDVDAMLEQDSHRFHRIDRTRQLKYTRCLLEIGTLVKDQLQDIRLMHRRPEHVLRAGEVGVGAI